MTCDYPHTRRGIYRSRDGWVFGVCRGVADHFDLSVFWIRAVLVGVAALTHLLPVLGLYLLVALIMKLEPRWT